MLKGLESGSLSPAYFLAGESAWLRGRVVARLRELAVPESWRGTSVETVWGAEIPEADAADTAATPPFGSPRRMLLIRNVEGFRPRKKGARKASSTPADSPLAAYLRAPSPTTVLVMVSEERSFGDWEGDPILKAVRGSGILVACDPPEKYGLAAWVAERASAMGMSLAPGVAEDLAERADGDQLRLEGELEKILVWAGKGTGPVTRDLVELLGGEAAPPNIFQFLDILFVERHAGKALSMLNLLLFEMHPLQLHAMMAMQIRKLVALQKAVREGWEEWKIARELKFPYPMVGRLTMMVNRTRPERFAELLGALATAEERLKRSRQDRGRQILESFVLEACGRK